ncbi:hypothetical protein RB195_011502 [Necator americanus]|uniref:Uncharacterized protein n=1 Tax=Necator americanus TaxID=51031 RepID=A0ABR1D3M5_NECAM
MSDKAKQDAFSTQNEKQPMDHRSPRQYSIVTQSNKYRYVDASAITPDSTRELMLYTSEQDKYEIAAECMIYVYNLWTKHPAY